MSRTFRNKTPRQDDWADGYNDDPLSQRRAKRLRKGADGVVSAGISASTVEGVYNHWDDAGSNPATKRMTHKDIRRHNKALVKAGLKELNDD